MTTTTRPPGPRPSPRPWDPWPGWWTSGGLGAREGALCTLKIFSQHGLKYFHRKAEDDGNSEKPKRFRAARKSMDEEEGFRPYKPPPPSPGRLCGYFLLCQSFILFPFIKHILYTCHEFRRVEYVGKEEKAC